MNPQLGHIGKRAYASPDVPLITRCDSEPPDVFCDVFEKNRCFFRNSALLAAIELGVFEHLAHPMTCEALSERLGARPGRLRALVHALVAEGYIRICRDGRAYEIGTMPDVPPALPRYGWGKLAEVIRTDRPLHEEVTAQDEFDPSGRLHDYLFDIGYPAAQRFWERMAPNGIGSGHLLDIGSGAGAYAAALLDRCSDASATLVDRGDILQLARERLGKYGKRVRFNKHDAFKKTETGYDTVLMANLLHLYGPQDCGRLVRTAAQALGPGGRLMIKDFRMEQDRTVPTVSVYFALNMALYTKAGDVYTSDEICRWVCEAGLGNIQVLRTTYSIVVIGEKLVQSTTTRIPGGVASNLEPTKPIKPIKQNGCQKFS